MKTAALLPTPGDPFVLAYWLRNYERVWKGEVDELQVLVNGQADTSARILIDAAVDAVGGHVHFLGSRIGHGEAIQHLLYETDADTVVLVEDDAWVTEPGAVAAALDSTKPWQVLGSPRGGMSPELEQVALDRWGAITGPDGSTGHGLWPCFLFANRATILATDRMFHAQTWRKGQTVPGIGVVVEGRDLTTDCMTSTAFQLRDAGIDIVPVPQHKELWQKDRPEPPPPWFHGGGLSNGDFVSPEWDGGGARAGIGGSNEGLDWAHRVWWWRRAYASTPSMHSKFRGYGANLNALESLCGIQKQVHDWEEKLKPWVTWNDGET